MRPGNAASWSDDVLAHEYDAMHALELTHWWFRGRRRILLQLLRRAMDSSRGRPRILDFGCGTGGNTSTYALLGSVFGLELDAAAVRLAHARGGARYCRSSATQLPFRNGGFDVVVASDVLEHIEDDTTAVSEITRVLRPGGVVVISVPAHQWLFSQHDAALHHVRRYRKKQLSDLLQLAGLRIRRLSYWNTVLFPAIALSRLLRRRHNVHELRAEERLPPPILNESLALLLAAEAALLRHASLPWGLSLIAVAERV
jgi:SAM-dependent methyltransferase